METKEKATVVLNLRLPREIHTQLVALHNLRPHLSLNALIVEAVRRQSEVEQGAKK